MVLQSVDAQGKLKDEGCFMFGLKARGAEAKPFLFFKFIKLSPVFFKSARYFYCLTQ